jgi:hypothetical protein
MPTETTASTNAITTTLTRLFIGIPFSLMFYRRLLIEPRMTARGRSIRGRGRGLTVAEVCIPIRAIDAHTCYRHKHDYYYHWNHVFHV